MSDPLLQMSRARKMVAYVSANPGKTQRQIAAAIFHGRTGVIRSLQEEGWLDAASKAKGGVTVWVPKISIKGRRFHYYGWMFTTDLHIVLNYYLWQRQHYATRALRIRGSRVAEFLRDSGDSTAMATVGMGDGEAAVISSNDSLIDKFHKIMSAELEKQVIARMALTP